MPRKPKADFCHQVILPLIQKGTKVQLKKFFLTYQFINLK